VVILLSGVMVKTLLIAGTLFLLFWWSLGGWPPKCTTWTSGIANLRRRRSIVQAAASWPINTAVPVQTSRADSHPDPVA
jgi:hypothetical protein